MKRYDTWADTAGEGICQGCGAPVFWRTSTKPKPDGTEGRMPFDRITVLARTRTIEGREIETIDLDGNHWATCKQASLFRRGRRR